MHSDLWGVLIFFWMQNMTTVIKRPHWWVQFLSVLRKNTGSTNLLPTFNRCRPDDICYYSACRQGEASEGNLCCWRALRPLSAPHAASKTHKASSTTVYCQVFHLLPPVRGSETRTDPLPKAHMHILTPLYSDLPLCFYSQNYPVIDGQREEV